MLHFMKDEETYQRFCLEILWANIGFLNLRQIGVDMEAAIFNGFQSVLRSLEKLSCVRHLQEGYQKAIENLQFESKLAEKSKASNKRNVLKDIYGKRGDDILEQGLADAEDDDA